MASKAAASPQLTPTEELVLEVLQARMRLGENVWTFSTQVGPAISRLQAKGLVDQKSGIVEDTLLVWPTDAGKVFLFKDRFTERIGSKKLAKRQKELRREALRLAKLSKHRGTEDDD